MFDPLLYAYCPMHISNFAFIGILKKHWKSISAYSFWAGVFKFSENVPKENPGCLTRFVFEYLLSAPSSSSLVLIKKEKNTKGKVEI